MVIMIEMMVMVTVMMMMTLMMMTDAPKCKHTNPDEQVNDEEKVEDDSFKTDSGVDMNEFEMHDQDTNRSVMLGGATSRPSVKGEEINHEPKFMIPTRAASEQRFSFLGLRNSLL